MDKAKAKAKAQSCPVGLVVMPEVVSIEREQAILKYLDTEPWSTELSRRTQHYGVEYDYQSRSLKPKSAPAMAGEVLEVAQWLERNHIIQAHQCIVNEYYRDQGIAPHVDKQVFGDKVVGLSLGADAVMEFTRENQTYLAWLPRRSLMIMTGEARYQWKHSIPKRVKYVNFEGITVTKPQDYRRVSLTYRQVS